MKLFFIAGILFGFILGWGLRNRSIGLPFDMVDHVYTVGDDEQPAEFNLW